MIKKEIRAEDIIVKSYDTKFNFLDDSTVIIDRKPGGFLTFEEFDQVIKHYNEYKDLLNRRK